MTAAAWNPTSLAPTVSTQNVNLNLNSPDPNLFSGELMRKLENYVDTRLMQMVRG